MSSRIAWFLLGAFSIVVLELVFLAVLGLLQ